MAHRYRAGAWRQELKQQPQRASAYWLVGLPWNSSLPRSPEQVPGPLCFPPKPEQDLDGDCEPRAKGPYPSGDGTWLWGRRGPLDPQHGFTECPPHTPYL